jgi:ribosomal protein L33
MSQDNLVKLKSTKSDHVYFTSRNKKGEKKDKLEVIKYDPTLRKRVQYKEVKK